MPTIVALPISAPQPSLEDRLDVVTHLLDELAEGVAALAAEAPKTSARLDEVEGKVSHLVDGLSELLAATQKIAQRLDAEDDGALVAAVDDVATAAYRKAMAA